MTLDIQFDLDLWPWSIRYINSETVSHQGRSHGSLEEEKSDSVSVYSSISQGSRTSSHEYDTASLHSGSVHSVPTSLQAQLRQQADRAHTIGGVRTQGRPGLGNDTYEPPTNRSSTTGESSCSKKILFLWLVVSHSTVCSAIFLLSHCHHLQHCNAFCIAKPLCWNMHTS